jgi:serine/threonine-protein kinase
VKEVFSAALERAPADRGAFLDEACGTAEGDVRREVETLLAAHEASDRFLENPAAVVAPAVPNHSGLAEGQTLGPYRVLRTLGYGGMATVYLARDERHHRSVALKVLHPGLAYALGPQRFLREIEVAANLSHPHILPLFDSGEVGGLLYYVMPYVEGESLRERLTRETQLPIDEALRIAREVADALAYAHGQGVIHRDIKPENILLSGQHALVADFGIARALGQAGTERLTETGMTVGTAAYMSPEQASGARPVDGRSDVYSLGCVLYEMLAGEPPYTGPTPQVIFAKRLSDPVPGVRRVRPAVPQGLEHVVTTALAPVPADRFATVADFVQALALPAASTAATAAAAGTAATAPAVPARVTVVRPTRRGQTLALAGAVGLILAGAGVLWQRNRVAGDPSPPTRLAVLPFENLGDSADAYFADGMTDAVRGKLSALPALQVIARQSSTEYRKTSKSPQQIGRELGVQYLLTGTVRWEKAGGASRVQVSPELVQVATASTEWQGPFDAAMTGVFQVQADIAGQVAQALHVALRATEKRTLAQKPTRNLAAYDAYLKGTYLLSGYDIPTLRRTAAYYEQAVALDPGFASAWAELSSTRSTIYLNGAPSPAAAEAARLAGERAVALAPDLPEGHSALAYYYLWVERDEEKALKEYEVVQQKAPNSVEALAGRVSIARSQGRRDAALAYQRQAQILSPRSVSVAIHLVENLLWLRRYPEALEASDRVLRLAPTSLQGLEFRAMIFLAQGDLAGAQAVIRTAPKEMDPAVLVANFACYYERFWMLDDAQQEFLLRLTPEALDGNRADWAMCLGQTHALRGDSVKARAYADSGRTALQVQLAESPDDPQLHVALGVAFAYLGRPAEAVREGNRAVALVPVAKDAVLGTYLQHQLARIYILVGDHEKALDQLEPLLKMSYFLSPGWLQIDPTFDPLRGHRRFQQLVAGKA